MYQGTEIRLDKYRVQLEFHETQNEEKEMWVQHLIIFTTGYQTPNHVEVSWVTLCFSTFYLILGVTKVSPLITDLKDH